MASTDPTGSANPPDTCSPAPDELRRAMKAFKKRLKLARLGRGPMTGGARSSIVAIVPPSQYLRVVWDELVKRVRLKYSGQGLYELVTR